MSTPCTSRSWLLLTSFCAASLVACVSAGDDGVPRPTPAQTYASTCLESCERQLECLNDRAFDHAGCVRSCTVQGEAPWADRFVTELGSTCENARRDLWRCVRGLSCGRVTEYWDQTQDIPERPDARCIEHYGFEIASCQSAISGTEIAPGFSDRSETLRLLCDSACRLDAVCGSGGSGDGCSAACAEPPLTRERQASLLAVDSACMAAIEGERRCLVGISCADYRAMRELPDERAEELGDRHPCREIILERRERCTPQDFALIDWAERGMSP